MKNQRTESENENLRDLLSRLQEENMQLKKKQQQHSPSQPFTFAISKDSPAAAGNNVSSPLQKDSPSASSTISPAPPQTNFLTPFTGSEFDFGSLIPFDPAVLNALDDTYTSSSASDDVMNLDFGFGKPNGQTFNVLASDPAYMSFAEPSPPESTSVSTPMNTINPFDFSALDQWSRSGPRSTSGDSMQTFDELFGGSSNFLSSSSGIDFAELMKKSPSLLTSSPVSRTNLNGNNSGSPNVNSLLTPSSTNSPETPFHKDGDNCPKTKEQLSETISKAGLSSFVVDSPGNSTSPTQCEQGSIPFLKKSSNKDAPMVMCRGSSFPKTEQNDKNIEVLSAWRTITSNPQFKVSFLLATSGTWSLM
jgi:AP-1-like factor